MIKILTISALYPPFVIGGAESSAASLVKGLTLRGYESSVITLTPANMSAEEIMVDGICVYRIPLKNQYWPYSVPKQDKPQSQWKRLLWHVKDSANSYMVEEVVKRVQLMKPDVILTHNLQGFSTAIWPALAKLNYPILHTVHDYSLLCPRTIMYKNGKNCGAKDKRCLDCRLLTYPRHRHAAFVSGVVGVSQAVLNEHLAHGLFANIPQIAILNSVKEGVVPTPKRIENNNNILTFGFLGRIDQAKGFITLLNAYSKLPKDRVRLIVGGRADDSFMQQIQKKYDLSHVEFLGFCNPEDFFQKIDVLVFPSFGREALGNGVFEAYFKGLPVIGSNQGGIPEMIEVGKTGFVFPKGDDIVLYNMMQRFLDEPTLASGMQKACLEKANYFLPARRIASYESMIKLILD